MSKRHALKQEQDASDLRYWERLVTEHPQVGDTIQFDPDSPFEELRLHNTMLHLVVLGFYSIPNPLAVVTLLLDHGATPNVQNDRGETPLHLVCRVSMRDPEIAKLLLERSADPNMQTIDGKRPVDLLGRHDRYSHEIRSMLGKSAS